MTEVEFETKTKGLEAAIKYNFRKKDLLATALTHTSYANEQSARSSRVESNERLEFLGDSVLSFVTSEMLYKRHAGIDEGELTKRRALIVCENSLYIFAKKIGLGECLLLGNGEERSAGRERVSILADAFEALLGAVFLDGGINAAKKFLYGIFEGNKPRGEEFSQSFDYKTKLQQFIQQHPGEQLGYRLVGESGPAHERRFEVEAVMSNNVIGQGAGLSKQKAEQSAAYDALKLFGQV